MEENIVHTALENLKKNTGIEGNYIPNQTRGLDGEMNLTFQNGKERFAVEVKREIRNHQLPVIENMARNNKKFLLIAETIFPKIKEELRKQNICYLDTAGNVFLKTDKLHLWIDGHKNQKAVIERPNRAFKTAGLKMIYLLLTDENLLNQPQRTIAEEVGIALGNINYILNGLKELKFLIEKNKKEFQLINKNELLQKWITGFEERLKPTLHIGNFRFLKTEDERNWKDLKLKQHQTFWGGEPAGDIMTHYLQPGIFTIYTDETRNSLMKNYRLIPDPNGNVRVYKKFWKDLNGFTETVVHPILAYTDLLNADNSRCIETAKMIYDKHIKQNI